MSSKMYTNYWQFVTYIVLNICFLLTLDEFCPHFEELWQNYYFSCNIPPGIYKPMGTGIQKLKIYSLKKQVKQKEQVGRNIPRENGRSGVQSELTSE